MTNDQDNMTQVARALTYRRAVRLTIMGAALAILGVLLILQPDISWTSAWPMVTAGLIAVVFFGFQARIHKPEACPQD